MTGWSVNKEVIKCCPFCGCGEGRKDDFNDQNNDVLECTFCGVKFLLLVDCEGDEKQGKGVE
jgi:hypothetical protein